jgi:hypothetical protein
VNLISEIESLRGRINYLNSEMGTTRVHITITTIPREVEPEPEPELVPEPEEEKESSLQRIGSAFMRSAEFTFAVVQGLLVFLTYVSIPLVVVLIIAACIWRPLRKRVNTLRCSKASQKTESGDENENK